MVADRVTVIENASGFRNYGAEPSSRNMHDRRNLVRPRQSDCDLRYHRDQDRRASSPVWSDGNVKQTSGSVRFSHTTDDTFLLRRLRNGSPSRICFHGVRRSRTLKQPGGLRLLSTADVGNVGSSIRGIGLTAFFIRSLRF